jgi:hypothetical protein
VTLETSTVPFSELEISAFRAEFSAAKAEGVELFPARKTNENAARAATINRVLIVKVLSHRKYAKLAVVFLYDSVLVPRRCGIGAKQGSDSIANHSKRDWELG